MASQNTATKTAEALADCTNTPISRPRRSCGSYKSSSATKSKTALTSPKPQNPSTDQEILQPQNPSNDAENAFASVGVRRGEQNGDPCVKNFGSLSANSPAGGGLSFLEDSEDSSQNIRVYSSRRRNKGWNSEKTPSSCPPLGSKYKTRRSTEPESTLRDVEPCKSAGGSRKHKQVSLGQENNKQRFGTPQPVLPSVDSLQFPESNEDADSLGSRFQFKWREEASSDKTSLSCPPLRRANNESLAGERSAKVQKRYSLGASEVLPKSGRSKKKVRRRDISTSADDAMCSLPEEFVRQQQAQFAEIDAFVLQEEMSDAD